MIIPCPTGKTQFKWRIRAVLALVKIQECPPKNGHHPVRVYECPACGAFHLTSQEKLNGRED